MDQGEDDYGRPVLQPGQGSAIPIAGAAQAILERVRFQHFERDTVADTPTLPRPGQGGRCQWQPTPALLLSERCRSEAVSVRDGSRDGASPHK